MEGIGCVLAGVWGCTSGLTSYSENVGIIGITKVWEYFTDCMLRSLS